MKRVFQLLNEMVRDRQISNYAIGGAIGAVFYIEPFATQDIDVFVMMETEPIGLVTKIPGWDYLQERGYTEIRGEAMTWLALKCSFHRNRSIEISCLTSSDDTF